MRRDPRLLFALLLAFSSPALAQSVVPVSDADWIVEGEQPTRTFGPFVAAGDVDGDGFDDLLIGDPLFDGDFDNSGRITIHRGSAAGLSQSPDWTVEGGASDARLGPVFAVGDVNGDGFGDIVAQQSLTGVLELVMGSSGGPSERTTLLVGSVRGHGDVNGDGFSDIGVTVLPPRQGRVWSRSPLEDNTGLSPQKLHLFLGSASGLPPTPSVSLTTAPRIGWVYDFTFEDLNGDGYSDLVAEWGGGFSIYLGSGEGLRTRPTRIIDYSREDVSLLVSAAGDVNGDGFGDLAVDKHSSNEFASFAELLLFWGSASGIRTQPNQVASFADMFLGAIPFGGAGDLNGDGFGDLMINERCSPFDECRRVKILSGSASGLVTLTLIIHGGISTASSAGDVNGDGYGDIVLSALGRVYVFHGEPSP